jgi:hypothetical protein
MNKFVFIALAFILLVVIVQAEKNPKRFCSSNCFKRVSNGETKENKKKLFQACISKCIAKRGGDKKITKQPVKKVVTKPQAKVESDSQAFTPSNGATLQATTGVNIRSGPCTSNSVVRTLQSGQTVTYTGSTTSGCGYTWYSVSGGYIAANYVREVSSGSSSTGSGSIFGGSSSSGSIFGGSSSSGSIFGGSSSTASRPTSGSSSTGSGSSSSSGSSGFGSSFGSFFGSLFGGSSSSSGSSSSNSGSSSTGSGSIFGGSPSSGSIFGGSPSTASRPTSGSSSSSSSGTCSTRSYPLFKQCDGSWGSTMISTKTVCKVGCLMSSVSMALNGLGKSVNGQSANPGTLNAYLKANGGYSGNLFVWGAASRLGLRYEGQSTTSTSIKNAICANKVVVLNVNQGGHWVLATGVTSSGYSVNDPGYSKSSYTFGEVVKAGIFNV